MIDLAILGMVFDQLLLGLTNMSPVDGTREDRRVVSTEVSVRLFAGHDQEVAIGVAAADVEVGFHLLETQRSRILRVAIAVEIGHHRDVDAERPEGGNPRRLKIEASGVQRLFVEVCVEMTDSHLEAGQWLVLVVVSELHYRFLCGRTWLRAEIVVNSHALPGPGWSIVKRKVSQGEAARLSRSPLPHFIRAAEGPVHLLAVGLADAHRE